MNRRRFLGESLKAGGLLAEALLPGLSILGCDQGKKPNMDYMPFVEDPMYPYGTGPTVHWISDHTTYFGPEGNGYAGAAGTVTPAFRRYHHVVLTAGALRPA